MGVRHDMPIRIETLICENAPLSPDMRAGALLERFLAEPACVAFPVVFERTLVGMVTRSGLFDLALRLNRSALDDIPLRRIVDSEPDIAIAGTPLGLVARMIADGSGKGFSQGIIVTHGGAYYGYVLPATLARELSAENTRRARQMQLAARKVEALREAQARSDKAGHEALARLGHEVRTPLTALLGHAERLTRTDLPAHLRKHADILVKSSEGLAELVSRSIEAGRLGAGAVQLQDAPLSLRAMAGELEALWRPSAEDKGLALDIAVLRGVPDRVMGDKLHLRQILCNLLSNAIKYTTYGGISLSVAASEREEGQFALSFSVTDTGPGIAQEQAARLFQPFQRFAGSDEAAGTGLGLNIARNLAEAMGGSLSYAPAPGGGSAFTLKLVLQTAGPRLAAEGAGPSPRARHITFQLGTILLIEDHPASQAVIRSTLKSAGWRVDTVDTLVQARRRAGHMPYQAILCDYYLRDGTGDLFLSRLREMPGPNRHTLCLAVTADASEARRQSCLAAGFAGVITKPIRGPELVTQLADYIASAADIRGSARATA